MSNFVDTTAENVRFVIKRNGEKVSFELSKMKSAITKAMESIDKVDVEMVEKIANSSEIFSALFSWCKPSNVVSHY